MKFNIKISIAALVVISTFAACKNGSSGDFETASSGIQYHFFKHDDKGPKPSIGDYTVVLLTLKNANDSVIYDAHHKRKTEDTSATVRLHLKENFKGSLADGIIMMAVGDSASFKVSADSLYLKTFKTKDLPSFIKAGSMMTFYIKLVSFQTPQQMADDMDKQLKDRQVMMEKRKADEQGEIEKYITDNKIKAKPENDGIYIIERTKGKGKPIKEGDSVEVKYTGMLLDGTVVETSDLGPGKNTFTLVYGKDHFVKGFDDIIANLENGGKVKAILPSSMAYGDQQQNHLIGPYTPLLYEVEVINVK